LGALAAPLVAGVLVDGGVAWQALLLATALAAILLGLPLALVPMPAGRHSAEAAGPAAEAAWSGSARRGIPVPLLLLCLAIGFYIAAEVGVSDWMVRFLASAPLSVATSSLALFWAGIVVGRLGSARIADRVDHIEYVTLAAIAMAIVTAGAVLVPFLPASVVLFGLAGVAAGPIAPMIVAVGGDRYPDRSAAVGGYLTTAAVAGSIGLPTVMGFMSVTVGLAAAMMTTVAFGLACAAALWIAGRNRSSAAPSGPLDAPNPGDNRPSPGPSSTL
jgi:fucose permease